MKLDFSDRKTAWTVGSGVVAALLVLPNLGKGWEAFTVEACEVHCASSAFRSGYAGSTLDSVLLDSPGLSSLHVFQWGRAGFLERALQTMASPDSANGHEVVKSIQGARHVVDYDSACPTPNCSGYCLPYNHPYDWLLRQDGESAERQSRPIGAPTIASRCHPLYRASRSSILVLAKFHVRAFVEPAASAVGLPHWESSKEGYGGHVPNC